MTAHYCTSSDLSARLTANGLTRAADRTDFDGTASGAELLTYIDPAIEAADTEIDAAIQLKYDTATARGNVWLKWIAIRIAAVEALTIGGRTDASPAMVEDRDRARKQLESVMNGELTVPGLLPRALSPYIELPAFQQTQLTVADLASG